MRRKKRNPNEKVTMTVRDIKKMKVNSTKESMEVVRMFTLLVLRDEYGFSQKRLLQFMEHFDRGIQAYNDDYLSLDDIADMLKEEVKIDIRKSKVFD